MQTAAPEVARRALPILLWLALTVAGLALAGGYVVDDAFVVFRVAERFAHGEGWSFQGSAPADGVTSPLWGALLALLAPLGNMPVVARVVGSLFTLAGGALILSALPARGVARRFAALFLVQQLPMVVWAGAGLETGLAVFVVALCTRGLFAGPTWPAQTTSDDASQRRGRPRGALLRALELAAFACVPCLRPELVPLAATAAALLPGVQRRAGQAPKSPVPNLAALGLGTGLVVVWRSVAFGHPFPLAALAKPSDPLNGFLYVGQGLLASGVLTALVIVGFARLRTRLERGDQIRELASWEYGETSEPTREGRAAVLVLAVGLLSVALAGGDWMPASRLLVPMLPPLAACVGLALAELPRSRWAAVLAVLLLPLATGAAALPELLRQPVAREQRAAQVLAALHGAERVALVDIGYLAYTGGFDVVDLGGITDLEIARLPGGHLSKRIPESLLRMRGVDAIVLHSSTPPGVLDGRLTSIAAYPVELHVARMPFVRDEFRVTASVAYAPDYHYVVLRRPTP